MPLSRWVQVAIAGLILAGTSLARPGTSPAPAPPAPARMDVASYMPLTPGRALTYENPAGHRFTLTFGAPTDIRWFDATAKTVVPVHDTRCDCHLLLVNGGGQVRAIGTQGPDGRLSPWGEYTVIFPGAEGAVAEPLVTPGGTFLHAIAVQINQSHAWFARGIGMVKIDDYALVRGQPHI